ncbi:MAG: hypothetical protein IPK13_16315 [Deltaproteobacteria bacterium]|nr:hypothetical protein [Deltaproteobacteria bacterium]
MQLTNRANDRSQAPSQVLSPDVLDRDTGDTKGAARPKSTERTAARTTARTTARTPKAPSPTLDRVEIGGGRATFGATAGAYTAATPTTASSPVRAHQVRAFEEGASEPEATAPTGKALPLTTALKTVIRDADRALNLIALNDAFNPLSEAVGPLARPSEIYEGKAFIPVQQIIGGAIAQLPPAARDFVARLLPKLNAARLIRGPAHQYRLDDGRVGNRVVFYGGDIGHKHIDHVVQELNKQHLRLAKQMVHFNAPGQGGSVDEILSDGVAGATHVGGFSAGYREGVPVSIKSDWPSSYGTLYEDNENYNASLFAIDYQAGTRDRIPDANLAAYKSNADMWDAIAGVVVPFTDEDPDFRYQDYSYNPLEVHDQASIKSVAKDLALLNTDTFLNNHGAFYCAEGQYVVANLGPNALIKKSVFGRSALGHLIDTFQSAPGVSREHPEIGWQHLLDTHVIDEAQYRSLAETDRDAIYLEWIPEEIEPWTAFRPFEKDGLIARPMTVATMAWALLRNYVPRERVAGAILDELRDVHKKAVLTGDREAVDALKILAGSEDPSSEAGQRVLEQFASQAATGFLVSILSNEDFRDRLLDQAGFREITNDADKDAVHRMYDAFIDTIQANATTSRADLDRAIRQADEAFGKLEVERQSRDPGTGDLLPARKSLMKYAAPQCFGFWAQHPELYGDSQTIRYVATAMHANQSQEKAGEWRPREDHFHGDDGVG